MARASEAKSAGEAAAGPSARSLAEARRLAAECRRCDLWRNATQTVFGEGPAHARAVFVGEQPGGREDIEGHPFVGPAGQVLDRALAEAGIARDEAYITNAVKHFKHVPRGKRRMHSKPSLGEIEACNWWLELELGLLKPRVVTALGGSAARALFRRSVVIGRERGRPLPFRDGIEAFVTIHPSYVLRQRDAESRERQYAGLVEDLRRIAGRLRGAPQ
jgi:DNA polymerase